jgi:CDP-glycerol glycerophosphotransferase
MPPMPLISIIIPVYNIEDYLQECLDSILLAPGPDIEVIAVDGGSTDKSAAMLDAQAAADPRVRIARPGGKIGPGRARNIGLAAATGEYVWFADGDDIVPPGSLQAVGAAAARDRPDVLLVDFDYLEPDGKTRPSPGRDLLRSAPAGCFSLADWPAAIRLTATVWSKLLRREFLSGLEVAFPPGIHEDVPVSFAALLRAEQISVLNRVCYRYRQRPGSFMTTACAGHFDIFDSYRQVFEIFDAAAPRPGTGAADRAIALRRALFERAIGHYATNLDGERVPRRLRRRYFARMHGDYLAYRPDGFLRPSGFRGVRYRLIERNRYLAYTAAVRLNRLRVLSAPPRTARSRSTRPAPWSRRSA